MTTQQKTPLTPISSPVISASKVSLIFKLISNKLKIFAIYVQKLIFLVSGDNLMVIK